ncbi:MAG TPA: DUF2381 family protein [Archangium sp.]|jgi:uncharacterized protein (TIGR02268 family)|uniref:DUF2381 family protein n=1 Tax=Archangium sp. TaxID=1872627 RepID=UPI002EDA5959
MHAEPVGAAPRRHVVLSEIPPSQVAEIRFAADVLTVLRFESELDPTGTRLLEQDSALHASLDVSGRLLLLHPSAGAWLWPRLHLQVRLADGTLLAFVLLPSAPAQADAQVDVFLHPATPGALRATLEKVRAEHAALKLEHARSLAELARYHEDEFNPDVAIAVLLLNDEASRSFLKAQGAPFIVSSDDVHARIWLVRLAGRSAYVFLVTNRHLTKDWTLLQGSILDGRTEEPLPVTVRARPSTIPPGGSGRVVLVTRTPPSAHNHFYSVQLQGPEGPAWQLCYNGAEL